MLAILYRHHGMGKDEFLDLNDWDVMNWLFRPDSNAAFDDPSKPYWPVGRADPKLGPVKEQSFKEMYFGVWRKQRPEMTEEELEKKFAAWFKGYTGA